MMAIAFGINSGGNILNHSSNCVKKSKDQTFSSNQFLPISNSTKKIKIKCFSTSIATSYVTTQAKDSIFSEKIDSWMQDSVSHIVKNLKQSPFLVHVYNEKDGASENGNVKLKTGKAFSEEWAMVRNEWESGEIKTPDGLIFVEELKENEINNCCDEGVARAWGVIVQGKGIECGPACYLLKTNRVCAGLGLGFCTHFCLVRVKSFSDSAFQQFQDSWLLQ